MLLHPSCFPNIATMVVVTQHDVLWEVHDNYQKQTYRNRYHICTDQGLHKLTFPIKHVGGTDGRQKYRDVRLDNSYSWQKQHWRTLQTAYRTSPFFEFYEDDLAPLFEKPFTFLWDFNWETLYFLADSLQMELQENKTDNYSEIVTKQLDGRSLVNAKKPVIFKQETYNQVFLDRHGFVQNASTLDLLFNEGNQALSYLKRQSLEFLYA